MLTAEHIRYAKTTRLEALTGISANTFSDWTHSSKRQMSGRMQKLIAQQLGMDKLEFIKGWDQRRQDALIARSFQDELDALCGEERKAS